jgi:hypothetical protein
MIINKLETYRDGGTIKVDTDKGVFYIDRRLSWPWRLSSNNKVYTTGKVYDDYPSRGNRLSNGNEIKKEIYLALENYTDDFYQKTNIDAIRSFLIKNKNE